MASADLSAGASGSEKSTVSSMKPEVPSQYALPAQPTTCAVLPSAKSRFQRPLSAPQPWTRPSTTMRPRGAMAPLGSLMSR